MRVRLDRYHGSEQDRPFTRGRPAPIEALWMVVQAIFVSSFIPGSRHRRFLLRLFGAHIGTGVVIKPGLRVKFPWRLSVGDHSWLGEALWIDNLDNVSIGAHAVLSQGAYLCTGNHNYSHPRFALITNPIIVRDQAWVCAAAKLAPGTVVGEGAVIGLGAVASGSLVPWTLYAGAPARAVGRRVVTDEVSDETLPALSEHGLLEPEYLASAAVPAR